jgi:siroheme synthase
LQAKQGYNDSSFSQEEVTTLIIEHAQQGKKVLRLKGGDVAFFSNVLDELACINRKAYSF